MQRGGKFINGLVTLAGFCALLSLTAVFSAHFILFDLISHFRVQYIALLLPVYVLAMWLRKSKAVLVISLALAIHGYAVTMSLLATTVNYDYEPEQLTVLNSNLLLDNRNAQAQLKIIAEKNPDLIALQEYTPIWHEVLSLELANEYPYRVTHPLGGVFGMALYSKHPILKENVLSFESGWPPIILAMVQVGERQVDVAVVHPPPPMSVSMYNIRNDTLRLVAEQVASLERAVIVIGDFNATPWTAHYAQMQSIAGLRSARAGFGFHPTWPANFFPLLIPIDHVLINSKVGVTLFESVTSQGSDHRNIVANLQIY